MSFKNWCKFGTLGLAWGSSFMWIKIAVQEISPFMLVWMRLFFAGLGLACLVILSRQSIKLNRKALSIFAILGFTNIALPFVLISWGEQSIDSSIASILNSTVPLFTVFLSQFFLKEERITLPKVIGLLIGFAGVIMLMVRGKGIEHAGLPLGEIALLVASLFYASSSVYARRNTQGLPAEVQALTQTSMAFLYLSVFTPLVDSPLKFPARPLTWVALIWLGLIGTSLGTYLYYSLLHSVGPTRTTLSSYLFPLVGVILGVLFLNEHPDGAMALGSLLIISSIWIVNMQPRIKPALKPLRSNQSISGGK